MFVVNPVKFMVLNSGLIEYHAPNDPEVSLYRYSIAFMGKAPFENVKSILIAIADAVAVRAGCPGGSALMFPNARAELPVKVLNSGIGYTESNLVREPSTV